MRRFESLGALIHWWLTHNPARQPVINLLEPDRLSTEQRDRDEETAAFCLTTGAISAVMADAHEDAARAFEMVWLRRPETIVTPAFHRIDAARLLRISEAAINRHLREITEALEREFRARNLLS